MIKEKIIIEPNLIIKSQAKDKQFDKSNQHNKGFNQEQTLRLFRT